MKFLIPVFLVCLAINFTFGLPARDPKDEAEVVSVPKGQQDVRPSYNDNDDDSDIVDPDFKDFKGVIDTGAGYPFYSPLPYNPFNTGFFDNFEDIFRRLRERVLNSWWTNIPKPGDADFDASEGNSTSEVKVIDGHKVVVNDTVYTKKDDSGNAIFRVRILNIRPVDSSEETDTPRINDDSELAPVTTTSPNQDKGSPEIIDKEQKDNEISGNIDSTESQISTTTNNIHGTNAQYITISNLHQNDNLNVNEENDEKNNEKLKIISNTNKNIDDTVPLASYNNEHHIKFPIEKITKQLTTESPSSSSSSEEEQVEEVEEKQQQQHQKKEESKDDALNSKIQIDIKQNENNEKLNSNEYEIINNDSKIIQNENTSETKENIKHFENIENNKSNKFLIEEIDESDDEENKKDTSSIMKSLNNKEIVKNEKSDKNKYQEFDIDSGIIDEFHNIATISYSDDDNNEENSDKKHKLHTSNYMISNQSIKNHKESTEIDSSEENLEEKQQQKNKNKNNNDNNNNNNNESVIGYNSEWDDVFNNYDDINNINSNNNNNNKNDIDIYESIPIDLSNDIAINQMLADQGVPYNPNAEIFSLDDIQKPLSSSSSSLLFVPAPTAADFDRIIDQQQQQQQNIKSDYNSHLTDYRPIKK